MNGFQYTYLFDDLATAGIYLAPRGIHLAVDAPPGLLTAERLDVIRQHKAELLEALRLEGPCDNCGSLGFKDRPIHQGRSVRRDCDKCGKTWGFPVWAGTQSTPSYASFASVPDASNAAPLTDDQHA